MPRQSSFLSGLLAKRYRSLELTRKKIERLVQNGKLSRRDSAHMYEGLFLNAYAAFEGFLEDLFIGLLIENRGIESGRSDIKPRVSIHSHMIAREVLIGLSPRKYIDWLPIERTLEMAKIYFRGGRPFNDLSNSQKSHLSKCAVIRNAIAHKSRYGLKKFEEIVIGNNPVLPQERKPAGYLQSLFRTSPSQTRYEDLVATLLIIARNLAQ